MAGVMAQLLLMVLIYHAMNVMAVTVQVIVQATVKVQPLQMNAVNVMVMVLLVHVMVLK
jgi:hypothetical protein